MFCHNCGTKNEDDALFCANCGTSLAQEQSQETQKNTIVEEQQEEEIQPAQMNQQAEETQPVQMNQQAEDIQPNVNDQAQYNGQQHFNDQTQYNGQQQFNDQAQYNGQQQFNDQAQYNGQQQFNDQAQYNGQQQYNAQAQYYGQQQYNGQAQYNGQPAAPKTPRKPIKITKKMIGIGAGILVALIAIITFCCIGSSGSNYKNTAKKYAQAVIKCDWDTAYDMVNLPDSEFLTKEAYKELNSDATPKAATSITVKDSYLYDYSSTTVGKPVTVSYSVPGASSSTMNLTMDVSPKKHMLFFKQYKVSSDSIVCTDITVRVPKGAAVSINGVAVADSYISTVSTSSTSSYSSYDTYIIPYLFTGINSLKVTGDIFQDYETTFDVSYNEDSFSVSGSSLTLKDEVVSELKTQAEQDLKTIMDACLANKDVSAINGRILSSAQSKINSNYGYSLSDCHSSSKDVLSLELSNVKASVNSTKYSVDSDDGYPTATVSLGYSKTGTYSYKSSSETVKNGSRTESSESIRYKYVDGKWLIYYFSLDFYIS